MEKISNNAQIREDPREWPSKNLVLGYHWHFWPGLSWGSRQQIPVFFWNVVKP